MDMIVAAAPAEFHNLVVFTRLAERALLILFFVVSAAAIMIAYRKQVQDVDLNVSSEAGAIKTTLSFAMPVFVLLTIILFAFIVLMHPIEARLSVGDDAPKEEPASDADVPKEPPVTTSFVGYGSGPDAEQKLARDLLAVASATTNLRTKSTSLSAEDQASIALDLDGLGRAQSGLRNMLFEIVAKRFPDGVACQPGPLTNWGPSQAEGCAEVNAFLFE